MPLLADLRDWLDTNLPLVPRQSALGKALNYMHKQWPSLIVYVEHGDLRIDNNLIENAIRPLVISRRNFLFCSSVAGANATANLLSPIETAKSNRTVTCENYLQNCRKPLTSRRLRRCCLMVTFCWTERFAY